MTQETLATALDLAQERANTGGETDRLAFFRLLTETPLFVLLAREAVGGVLEPRIFALEEGPCVLAFDREERLAALADGPQSHAEIPGRVLAQLLADEGLGLGLNLGTGSASETLLPASAMVWLRDMLDSRLETRRGGLVAPSPADPALAAVVQHIIATAPALWGGLAHALWVCSSGGRGVLLVEGAAPQDEAALARALAEALAFAGHEASAPVEVAFGAPDALAAVGTRMVWPPRAEPAEAAQPARSAPGMDINRPPILR